MKLSQRTISILLIFTIILFPIFLIILLVLSFLTAKNMANPKSYSQKDILKEDIKGVRLMFDLKKYSEEGPMITEKLIAINKEEVEYEIWGKKTNKKYVILVHGMYNTRGRMYKYAKIWNDMGYNAVTFDGRGWGTNTKFGKCTYGSKEADLVQEIYLDLIKKYKTKHIGLHGESMGGATVFNWVKKYRKFTPVKFIVTEGGYMNFKIPSVLGIQKHGLPKWTAKTIYPLVKVWLCGYGINLWKGTVRKRDVKNWFDMPMLLMHSVVDDVVPFAECSRIKKMLETSNTKYNYYESPNAEHVRMIINKEEQNKWVVNLKEFVKGV